MSQPAAPYQATAVVGDSATCPGGQCQFTFPTVPAGKRLLITSVSAQLGRATHTIVMEGNGVSYFGTKTHPDLGNVTAPVTLYYEAGSTPAARVFAGHDTAHVSHHHARRRTSSRIARSHASLVCDYALVSVADHQTLRVLEGRYVLERVRSGFESDHGGEVLAVVHGPDGGARMRREDSADSAWVALWNGDEAHPPDATGMLAAIVAPLASGNVPVWVAASFDGDIVLVPADRVDEASEVLRQAGHHVIG